MTRGQRGAITAPLDIPGFFYPEPETVPPVLPDGTVTTLEDLPSEDLATGLDDRSEGGEQSQAEGESESDPATHGVPPEWQALMAEAHVFEAWYESPRMGVNAWVGVDTISGFYGGWSIEGDHLHDDWDESEMMTASGNTPLEVIASLIDIARRYRKRRDDERLEE